MDVKIIHLSNLNPEGGDGVGGGQEVRMWPKNNNFSQAAVNQTWLKIDTRRHYQNTE